MILKLTVKAIASAIHRPSRIFELSKNVPLGPANAAFCLEINTIPTVPLAISKRRRVNIAVRQLFLP